MKEKKVEPRWFIIRHECGSFFTVNTERFAKAHSEKSKTDDDIELELRCSSCQKKIEEDTVKAFLIFLEKYIYVIAQFREQGFDLREIRDQDQDSLVSQ